MAKPSASSQLTKHHFRDQFQLQEKMLAAATRRRSRIFEVLGQSEITQALYLSIEVPLYTAERDNFRYTDVSYERLCSEVGIAQHSQVSRIRQQLKPSLDDLVEWGGIARWQLKRPADGKTRRVRFWPYDPFYDSKVKIRNP